MNSLQTINLYIRLADNINFKFETYKSGKLRRFSFSQWDFRFNSKYKLKLVETILINFDH